MTMTCDTTELDLRYRGMLSEYLAHPDEAVLERAYGLGREALASGYGVLDMATMHSQAMAAMPPSKSHNMDLASILAAVGSRPEQETHDGMRSIGSAQTPVQCVCRTSRR